MSVFYKLAGIAVCIIGLLIWCLDAVMIYALGSLISWIANVIGMTGFAVFGLQAIGLIVFLGTILFLLFCGVYVFLSGLSLFGYD